jgi:hypothetical protein
MIRARGLGGRCVLPGYPANDRANGT